MRPQEPLDPDRVNRWAWGAALIGFAIGMPLYATAPAMFAQLPAPVREVFMLDDGFVRGRGPWMLALWAVQLVVFLVVIVQIVAVELFVMFFEVMFLYREIVDALTPWIAQQTGTRPGLVFTMTVAVFGWVGIRGMTWFLFGQYGTAPLLAFISRRPIEETVVVAPAAAEPAPMPAWWREPLADFKEEIEWLHAKSEELLEYLALPVIHLLAAGLNFGMVLVASRPVFHLPFKALREVTEARDQLAAGHLKASKQASL